MGGGGGGGANYIYLTLSPPNFCIHMGSDESHFNVSSLINCASR